MKPGTIRIVRVSKGLFGEKVLLISYTRDENIIIIDLNKEIEIYRRDKNE